MVCSLIRTKVKNCQNNDNHKYQKSNGLDKLVCQFPDAQNSCVPCDGRKRTGPLVYSIKNVLWIGAMECAVKSGDVNN